VIARPSILADSSEVAHFASVLAAITVPMAIAAPGCLCSEHGSVIGVSW